MRRNITICSALTRWTYRRSRNNFIRYNSPRIQALTELEPTRKNKNITINKKKVCFAFVLFVSSHRNQQRNNTNGERHETLQTLPNQASGAKGRAARNSSS